MKTDNKTLADALRIAASEMISGDGVVPAAMYEAAKRIEELEEQLAVCRAFIAHREAAAKHDAKRIKELEASEKRAWSDSNATAECNTQLINECVYLENQLAALIRWDKAKNGLNDAIDSCDPDECDHWHDEIAAAEKALLDQLKETDDDDNA